MVLIPGNPRTLTPDQRNEVEPIMSEQDRRSFLTPDAPLTDNIALLEWFEQSRRALHLGSLILGGISAELDAKLRKVNPTFVVAGLTSVHRARQVSRPTGKAAEALNSATKYIITASNRFEAGFMPELEAAGYKPTSQPFKFRAR